MADPSFADQELLTDSGNITVGDTGNIHFTAMLVVSLQQAMINGISGRFVATDHALVIFFVTHVVNNLYRPPISPAAIRL